jgi:methylmalonyl-CoA/ethylmalonyl-CoA epimerase
MVNDELGTTKGLDHIGIAVNSIEQTLALYEVLGIRPTALHELPEHGVKAAMMPLGATRIELLEPMGSDSPVGRYLAKRGEGIHHICLVVDDIDQAVVRLGDAGIRLVDREPRLGADGRRVVFLHPTSTHGVLIELSEEDL